MSDDIIERARRYVARMDPAISGQGGHQAAWRVAQALVRGFSLSNTDAEKLFLEYNERCQPRWNKRDVTHKLESARAKSQVPVGYLLHARRDEWACDWKDQWKAEWDEGAKPREEAPIDWLPPVVRDWVVAQAEANSVPVELPLAAAMAVMATVLQGKVQVQVRPKWLEPLSVFWIVAAPSGGMKSRVLADARRPVTLIEDTLAERAREQAKTNRKTRLLNEGRIKKLRSIFAAKGGLSVDQQNQLDSLEAENENMPIDRAPRWIQDNVNPALLPRLMQANHEVEGYARLAIVADEDTFLRNVLGRHSGHVDLSAVLNGYTGGRIDMVRKSVSSDAIVEVHVENAHLTMLVLTQPHVIDSLKEESLLADQGFWGRCIVSDVPSTGLPAHDATPVPDGVQKAWERLVEKLHALPGGQVIRVPETLWEANGELARLYADTASVVEASNGAEHYAVRTVGRVCRFWAICELARAVSAVSAVSDRPMGPRAHAGGIEIRSISTLLYYQALKGAQERQPPTASLAGATRRVLGWLRQREALTVGSTVASRDVQRATSLKKDAVRDALDELCEMGILEPGLSVARRGGNVTVTYRVKQLVLPEQTPKTTGAS